MPPRRFQLLFGIVAFIVFSLVLFGPPSADDIPTVEDIKETLTNPKLPSIPSVHSPFGPGAHTPPIQPNSTSGDAKWFSDWKWKNPFSSTITLDENRAVLPPLAIRPPIYTYYESRKKQDEELSKAEHTLLLAWRRAWWAQGFKPQVLSRAEAQKNPLYEPLQRLRLDPKLDIEIARWLAWGHMGTGVLANFLALPMAPQDNPMLSYLRRGEYPKLSRVESLQNGVFFGEKGEVNNAIKKVLEDPIWRNFTANKDKIDALVKEGGVMINLLDEETMKEEKTTGGIAFYHSDTLVTQYKVVAEKLNNTNSPEGLKSLATLINSHLHQTWQESFPSGIAILKPLPEHTTALTEEAIDIARNLTQCSYSPMPASCPPNNKKCKPCVSSSPMRMKLLPHFRNDSTLYVIGSVPHPYTLNMLHYQRETLDGTFIRRNTDRDVWVFDATKELLGSTASGQNRVVRFKEAVASPRTASHSLWLTAERESQADLDWIFGFNLPQSSWDGKTETPVPGPERRPPPPEEVDGVKKPAEEELRKEHNRLTKAREAIKSKARPMQRVLDMVEKWNLADTEAWRFARAFSARRRVERRKWEEEEQGFAGAEKKAGVGGAGGRWSD
jgi:hypothetical protein